MEKSDICLFLGLTGGSDVVREKYLHIARTLFSVVYVYVYVEQVTLNVAWHKSSSNEEVPERSVLVHYGI